MSIELGHFALILAFVIAAAQSVLGFAFWRSGERVSAYVQQASVLQFVLVLAAFVAIMQAFVLSDFSLLLAFEHSHSQQPLLFKFTSVWGNHEGSILLWILILVLFGGLVAAFGRNLPNDLRTLVLSTQGLLTAAFTGFTLFTSNPFERLDPAPFEGRDLNPVLQDVGLAIHPPLLYLGYVGLSVCFSFAIAALISGRIDAAWARWVRPWTLLSWVFLTLGIAMGSYWAYYELGWGGWWFWDPVENASLMPWLAATALLHSALVMEKRAALKIWSIFLAIIAFSLSLMGTFLVRSGVLTSVHSFASDPSRGLVILAILAVLIGGAFTLFALRASSLRQGGLFAPISREGALILNNLFLATATAAVLVGTLYPLLLEAVTGNHISVGAPFFNLTFGALMLPLLVLIPLGPFMAWKRADIAAVVQRLTAALILTAIITLAWFVLLGMPVSLAPLGLFLGLWVAIGSLADLADRVRLGRVPLHISRARLFGLPRIAFSTTLAHFGMGVTMIGIVFVSAWSSEVITTMQDDETREIAGYTVTHLGTDRVQGPNYVSEEIGFEVDGPYGTYRLDQAERRVYSASGQPTTEAAIETFGLSQLYISPGEVSADGSRVVRIWYKPNVLLVWGGAILMAFAGLISLSDRRVRVGVPAKARRARLEPVQ